jgi:hypothetical protein
MAGLAHQSWASLRNARALSLQSAAALTSVALLAVLQTGGQTDGCDQGGHVLSACSRQPAAIQCGCAADDWITLAPFHRPQPPPLPAAPRPAPQCIGRGSQRASRRLLLAKTLTRGTAKSQRTSLQRLTRVWRSLRKQPLRSRSSRPHTPHQMAAHRSDVSECCQQCCSAWQWLSEGGWAELLLASHFALWLERCAQSVDELQLLLASR